jgi:hypothetical protein
MDKKKILLGDTILNSTDVKIDGGFVEIKGEKYYKISNYSHMTDFFMTIVSDSDHWMFLSSNGSLSAGRKNRDNALFPYYTDDKIHDYCGITGSNTLFIVEKDDRNFIWQPFSKEYSHVYKLERNLYKSVYGNKIIFEEINQDLEVAFSYGWSSSEKFGFVKTSKIKNLGGRSVKVELIDGIQNILPSGLDYAFQNEYSNLLDGYKKNELVAESELGLFMLSSIPVDRAEPSESLSATTVWSRGMEGNKVLLSNHQLAGFKMGEPVETEQDVRATRGAFYVNATEKLDKDQKIEWIIVAEINQSTTDVANLSHQLIDNKNIVSEVLEDVDLGTSNLIKIVAAADGMQVSNEELGSARHFSNTLYNVMRGGIYLNNYTIESKDFIKFVEGTNKKVAEVYKAELDKLPTEITNSELITKAVEIGNTDFLRICYEYLPLTFSRRHGDPSRPWNLFSIDTKNEDGSPKSDYQGNWRDIFQNWEALSLSYPDFIENIISKFLNASTPDGYNPYRIMRNGIDWECPDPDDPWAYIGYWGDHQIIYLQKLFELSEKYHPGKLNDLLTKEVFAYANVPYRIKGYADIVKNPQDTIEFDSALNDKIKSLVEEIGADGRLLMDSSSNIYKVNLAEKMLVTLLSKLSNFIPEAGIWLNTQRPEWNDANNALVGSGVSMVTLYYIRRFLQFWKDKLSKVTIESLSVSEEVQELFDSIYKLFSENTSLIETGFSNEKRRYFTDFLGQAGELYRNKVYANSFSGTHKDISVTDLVHFLDVSISFMDQSIEANKRKDGLYHSYNLVSFNDNAVSIRYLYEMLEGQVAVLSAGSLSTEEGLNVLDSLKVSKLYREDQYSYILYPDRQLARFNEKNNIPVERVSESKLLLKLLEDGDISVVTADISNDCHFNSSFRNAEEVNAALDKLKDSAYAGLVEHERSLILDIYEEMFDHQSFTGRSGTFYAYEGLGSIYWHMVSKLLLAAEEYYFKAVDEGTDEDTIGKLKNHYYEIKAGIGLYKSPDLYGAFPTDAYSHTPGNAGVKQPGMTGQVKEDVITRMGELGVRINDGEINFDTRLLNRNEFLIQGSDFTYVDLAGNTQKLKLDAKQLAFTLCQVPVTYMLAAEDMVTLTLVGGEKKVVKGNSLDTGLSSEILNRSNQVKLIEVAIKE